MSLVNIGSFCKTPLLDKCLSFAKTVSAPFYIPGHKGGRSLPEIFSGITQLDLNNLPGTDTLHCPTGAILEAEGLLAQAYGVVQSFLLVGGSTSGNIASILSACREGQKILVQRNCHKSTLSGVILSGVQPVWLQPEMDPVFEIAHGVSPKRVAQVFESHPEAIGIVVLNPTYFGTVGDITSIKAICSEQRKLLLVDEAHGPHFHFHENLPIAAEDIGADLIVQSTHKILSAMSQGAVLHRGTEAVSEFTVRKALQLIQTTSPSFPIMVSIDIARSQMQIQGKQVWGDLLDLVLDYRNKLSQDFLLLDPIQGSGFIGLDPTKIVISANSFGVTGYELQRSLNELGIEPELAGNAYILCILGVGTTDKDLQLLYEGLHKLKPKSGQSKVNSRVTTYPDLPESRLSPREAFMSEHKRISFQAASGQVCGEVITPYPPGIPVIVPGEVFCQEIIDFLTQVKSQGCPISVTDPNLETVEVVI